MAKAEGKNCHNNGQHIFFFFLKFFSFLDDSVRMFKMERGRRVQA